MKRFYASVSSLTLVFVLLLCTHLIGQTPSTIPEMIARGEGWGPPQPPSGSGPPLRDVLRQTEIIVRGIIGYPLPSYLSADQTEVQTDYPIFNYEVLYRDGSRPLGLPAGRVDRMMITVRGGSVIVNGVPFDARYPGQPELKPETEAMFLLQVRDGQYRVVGHYYGVFGIANGRLLPPFDSPTFASEYRGSDAELAVRRIVSLMRSVTRQ